MSDARDLKPNAIFDDLKAGRILLVDVREPSEFANQRIHGALLMPLSTFEPKALPIDSARRIVFQCGSGKRSRMALDLFMAATGADAPHMDGARVEAADTATARSRLQGVVSRLLVDEGSVVKTGDLIAVITDATIDPQMASLESRTAGLKAQAKQSAEDVARAEGLAAQGFYPTAHLDTERTALDVLRRSITSAEAEQRALAARRAEGRILAPADAKVTAVNVVTGSIVSPGDVIASFATLSGIVRLSLPERHAAQLKEGETVTLKMPSRDSIVRTATIMKIYPELRDGAVVADATVTGGRAGTCRRAASHAGAGRLCFDTIRRRLHSREGWRHVCRRACGAFGAIGK